MAHGTLLLAAPSRTGERGFARASQFAETHRGPAPAGGEGPVYGTPLRCACSLSRTKPRRAVQALASDAS